MYVTFLKICRKRNQTPRPKVEIVYNPIHLNCIHFNNVYDVYLLKGCIDVLEKKKREREKKERKKEERREREEEEE